MARDQFHRGEAVVHGIAAEVGRALNPVKEVDGQPQEEPSGVCVLTAELECNSAARCLPELHP